MYVSYDATLVLNIETVLLFIIIFKLLLNLRPHCMCMCGMMMTMHTGTSPRGISLSSHAHDETTDARPPTRWYDTFHCCCIIPGIYHARSVRVITRRLHRENYGAIGKVQLAKQQILQLDPTLHIPDPTSNSLVFFDGFICSHRSNGSSAYPDGPPSYWPTRNYETYRHKYNNRYCININIKRTSNLS